MDIKHKKTPKLRYELSAILESLKVEYPEVQSALPEVLKQDQIAKVFTKRKMKKNPPN